MIYISEIFGAGLSHKGIEPKATFPTIQGEGAFTGRSTIFVRFFGCSLRCEGFSQPNPADRSTYKPTIIQQIDPKSITKLSEFKTPSVGCDTAYAVYPQFKHLRVDYSSAEELYNDSIVPLLYKTSTGNRTWKHPVTKNTIDLCFTGGEPMMHQDSMIEILQHVSQTTTDCINVQIETNATRKISDRLRDYIGATDGNMFNYTFNVSPKLLNVAGERDEDAWFPDIIMGYTDRADVCLKFVVTDKDECWDELNKKVSQLDFWMPVPIYVMPAGAVYHQQTDQQYIRTISERALREGYYVSPRLHVNIWDGCVGC